MRNACLRQFLLAVAVVAFCAEASPINSAENHVPPAAQDSCVLCAVLHAIPYGMGVANMRISQTGDIQEVSVRRMLDGPRPPRGRLDFNWSAIRLTDDERDDLIANSAKVTVTPFAPDCDWNVVTDSQRPYVSFTNPIFTSDGTIALVGVIRVPKLTPGRPPPVSLGVTGGVCAVRRIGQAWTARCAATWTS